MAFCPIIKERKGATTDFEQHFILFVSFSENGEVQSSVISLKVIHQNICLADAQELEVHQEEKP